MVNEWILNLSSTEIILLFFAMAIVFYGFNKMEKDKKDKENKENQKKE